MSRILAVSHTPVWPIRSGSSIRRLMTLEALAGHGDVDLLYVGEAEGLAAAVPADAPVATVIEHPVARRSPGPLQRAAWSLRPRRPLQVLEWGEPVRPLTLPTDGYDLVWYFRALARALVGEVDARASVVDLDDLEDDKLRVRRATLGRHRSARRRFAESRNAAAWHRFQRSVAGSVDAVTVCSEHDCRRLGRSNCLVVPNGVPAAPEPHPTARQAHTMLLVGLFEYEPNADAAEFMAREVLPRIREPVADAELRLVGRSTPRVERLAGPGVTIVGEVPDLSAEYGRAAISVAPVRFGGGTRIKIIESFARRVPVVSTTMGAAGLDARDGEALLLADDASSFADACVRLMTDEALGDRIVAGGCELYEQRFDQDAITRAVGAVVAAARAGG